MKLVALMAVGVFAGAPLTTITSGPSGDSTLTSPTFEFISQDAAATFQCSLDSSEFEACTSPRTVGPLAQGGHTFSVRSIAADGTAYPDASRSWNVVASPVAFAKVTLKLPKKRLKIASFKRLEGSAASPSGVSSVYAALQRGRPDKEVFPPGCIYTNLRSGRLIEQPCLLPNYTKVKGTDEWSYSVPAKVRRSLTPGTYKLIFRAFNGFDQALRQDFKVVFR